MSDKHKHIAFLCGHFKRTEAVDASALQAAGWLPVNYTDKARQKEKRFYYPDFVDFCYAQSMDEGCVRFKRQVNQPVSIKATQVSPERTLPFTVKEITLYFLPQRMVLYSIRVEQEVSTFDDCSLLMYNLRYIDNFASEAFAGFIDVAVKPIVEVYNRLKNRELEDYSQLVENGNKLRLFQIVHTAAGSLTSDEQRRRQLYQLGTFMPVATGGEYDSDGLFTEHQRKEFNENSVTVFPGWSAFALLDSFTILASDSEGQTDNWEERYFGMIYIQALFQKTCLFDFNNRFKRALNNRSRKEVEKLVDEYENFERNCCFNKISYNFLPLLISDSIDNSLEINDEMKQVFDIMRRERTRSEDVSRKKMNSLLLAISFLTLFSAIWDACSMMNEMMSFESHFGSTFKGFRIVGLIMAIIVVGVLVYLYKRKRGK